jgi:glycosyltransferase involved in cell wall biosynthesis
MSFDARLHEARMKLYIFALRFPTLYTPYLDDQYSDLLERGHDLTFLADSSFLPDTPTPRQQRLIQHTRYYDVSERTALPAALGRAAVEFAAHPARRTMQLRHAGLHGFRSRANGALRLLNMPLAPPDACIVNGTRTLLRVSWLKRIYPSATVCFYYHGGGLHGVTADEVFPNADLVLTNTASARRRLAAMGCPERTIRVLPVGFDPGRYPLTERTCYRRGGVVRLVSASRISEEKGHIYALRALAELRSRGFTDLRYTIIGGGTKANVDGVRKLVTELGLDDVVHLAGEMPSARVIEALAEADALLLPSIQYGDHAETQAAIVQEAMLMRAAIIVSDVGGVPESVPPFWSEWCIPPADPEAIAAAVMKLAGMPVSELQAQTLAAREWTMQHYSTAYLNDRMLGCIREFRGQEGATGIHPRAA